MLENAEMQRKMHEELDRIVGSARHVTMDDKPVSSRVNAEERDWFSCNAQHLPYTAAVVTEALRLANILVVNVLHQTTRDVKLDGFTIPKGTCIVPQISTVLYDEEVDENAFFLHRL